MQNTATIPSRWIAFHLLLGLYAMTCLASGHAAAPETSAQDDPPVAWLEFFELDRRIQSDNSPFFYYTGSEKVEATDEKTYQSIVKQKVGPISVKLNFTTTLAEIEPPRYLKAVGRGADMSKLGTFTQETIVNLTEVSGDEVEVSYSSNVGIVGRLATFGERIMRAKSKSVGEEFTKNLQEKLKSRIGR